jgi:hypothetical protein
LPELSDQRVPTGRVPQRGGGDHAVAGTIRCYAPVGRSSVKNSPPRRICRRARLPERRSS